MAGYMIEMGICHDPRPPLKKKTKVVHVLSGALSVGSDQTIIFVTLAVRKWPVHKLIKLLSLLVLIMYFQLSIIIS